jgi:hypothetical protein
MDTRDRVISIHEAAHAVTARFFGFAVEAATMSHVDVAWSSANKMLIMSAAGDAATSLFFDTTGTGCRDDRLARVHLKTVGYGLWEARRLMRRARENSIACVRELKYEIFDVADALIEHRTLSQNPIDALL